MAERNPAGAAHWGRRAQDIEADDEGSLRRLMELLDRSGDAGGAIRAYDEFAARLKAELGVEPSATTRTLVERLRTALQALRVTARVIGLNLTNHVHIGAFWECYVDRYSPSRVEVSMANR